ncbi:hypothetical protein IE077_003093 [Cardiosporidium cionae]|uniref:Uncharacterized protein n=1 Tax=Cardiosporidium cionae TaxID=476202 RepID=A0ABQ7J486_9APIC|nr:hypothetical protein IE077_003093 [Cardiosporidium cionae]|eukprot:KAF8817890.1 hypothetical protein IE077_003093 [Cardiosporidium cionae]
MSLHRVVGEKKLLDVYREVYKWGKTHDVHKMTNLVQNYEKYCWRRVRLTEEKMYFRKWHYLKYACEVVRFSEKNNLRNATPFHPEDSMRLASITPGSISSIDGISKRLKEIVVELNQQRERVLQIDRREFLNSEEETIFLASNTTGVKEHAPAHAMLIQMVRKGKISGEKEFHRAIAPNFTFDECALLYTTLLSYAGLKQEQLQLEVKKGILQLRQTSPHAFERAYDEETLSTLLENH